MSNLTIQKKELLDLVSQMSESVKNETSEQELAEKFKILKEKYHLFYTLILEDSEESRIMIKHYIEILKEDSMESRFLIHMHNFIEHNKEDRKFQDILMICIGGLAALLGVAIGRYFG